MNPTDPGDRRIGADARGATPRPTASAGAQAPASPTAASAQPAATDPAGTVEAHVRGKLASTLGGPRGALETAAPFIAFTLTHVVTDQLRAAIVAGVATAAGLLLVRLVQRSTTRFVAHAVLAIAVAALVATTTGRAESAFLPGIVQAAGWGAGLAASIAVRRPAAGFVIGAVLGDPSGWRRSSGMVRLGDRLTVVLLVPMLLRVAVQYPLYLAGAVGWLGLARVAMGWPLHVATLAAAAAILARGRTPLPATATARDDPPT